MNQDETYAVASITDETLIALFRRTAHFMARAYHHQGHAHHAQKHVLSILREKKSMNQRDLMEILGVRSASLSELLGKLEKNGLITREKDERDRRNIVISITDAGIASVKDHVTEQRKSAEAVLGPLTRPERQQLGELLLKILVALEDEFPDQGGGRPHEHGSHGCCEHGPGWLRGHGRFMRNGEDGERGPHDPGSGRGHAFPGQDGECGHTGPGGESPVQPSSKSRKPAS
ncbi:MAG: MarR family transcriptional regulator [Deltaproteobacteria bacterium]|nr:MarR family transcriptional regulator [Deltaproteobacteria bacterium]